MYIILYLRTWSGPWSVVRGPVGSGRVRPVWSGLVRSGLSGRPERSLKALEGLCPVFSGLPAFEGLLWEVFEGHWGVFWGLWKAFGKPWGVFGRSFGGL